MKCDSHEHNQHMCSLRAQGQEESIKELSTQPTVECKHCGAKANSIKNVCAAHMLDTAPNVEGGHGSVRIEDVGKPHAGPKKEV